MKTESTRESPQKAIEPETSKRRLRNFLAAYALGSIFVALYYSFAQIPDFKALSVSEWITAIIGFVVAIPFVICYLPFGTALAIDRMLQDLFGSNTELFYHGELGPGPENTYGWLLVGLSYLFCILIPFIGGLAGTQRKYRILLLVYVVLIIVNVGGCTFLYD